MSWNTALPLFAEAFPGFEERPEQTRLAHKIETGLANNEITLAQGGCGIGKSFGLLVPAIERAKALGEPFVVSTYMKGLQDQYALKDGPTLKRIFEPVLGEIKIAVIKGRGNYTCKAKLNDEGVADVANIAAIREELGLEGATGDMDLLITEYDAKDKPKLVSTSDECVGKRNCPFGDVCFAEMAKDRAKEADLVITNHALLVTDAVIRAASDQQYGMLPEYSLLGIDEAHKLEDAATGALGKELSQGAMMRFAAESRRFLDGNPATTQPLLGAAEKLFSAMTKVLDRAGDNTIKVDDRLVVSHMDEIEGLRDQINAVAELIGKVNVRGDDKKAVRKSTLMRNAGSLLNRLDRIAFGQGNEWVRWVERNDRGNVVFKYAPLSVAEFLHNNLWNTPEILDEEDGRVIQHSTKRTAVLMSATLAVGSDFSFLAGRLGISDYVGFDAGSPFDFPKQLAVYVPEGFPEPTAANKATWRAKFVAETGELIRAAGGRALILFTSRVDMVEAHRSLAPMIRKMGHKVLLQGEAAPGTLTREFLSDEHAVLFGLETFMTGFDAQGDTLRLVVISKLTFANPKDVMVAARGDAIDKANNRGFTGSAFMTYSVPSMALTLLQAVGRAIRTKQDEALVAVFDSRLHSKPSYGKKILNALPNGKRIVRFADAEAHLAELTARRG